MLSLAVSPTELCMSIRKRSSCRSWQHFSTNAGYRHSTCKLRRLPKLAGEVYRELASRDGLEAVCKQLPHRISTNATQKHDVPFSRLRLKSCPSTQHEPAWAPTQFNPSECAQPTLRARFDGLSRQVVGEVFESPTEVVASWGPQLADFRGRNAGL